MSESMTTEADVTASPADGPPGIGFFIRRLVLVGTHVPRASLEFRRGLNIITGPSDTGKSFALQCIDFAFGATESPKPIPESRGYEWVALEIEAATGAVFTAERALKGTPVRWFTSAFEDIGSETEYEEIAPKHNPKSQKTLSYRLLELCGLADRVLRKNKRNETRSVSFRNMAKLVVVDEERVISRTSPVLGGQKTDETADKSLFALLLSGSDASGVVPATATAERKQRLEAQRDLLDTMLGPAPSADEPARPDRAELSRQRAALTARAEELSSVITVHSHAVDEAAAEREVAHHTVVEAKSRLLVVDQLLSRFALLRRSYETDLLRLDFIAEGHHFLEQLAQVTCPACNRPLDGDAGGHAFCAPGTPEAEDVQAACVREASKIRTHLRDLEHAVAELERERGELARAITEGTARSREAEERVRRELRPQLALALQELKRAQVIREQVLQEEAALDHRAGLLERRQDIERALIALLTLPDAPSSVTDAPYNAFASVVGDVLREWRYPAGELVSFDTRAMDVVVGRQARATHGKGVRAIMFSAFVIGLMRYCRARGLPHPGFVVLDSPLTSYRRPGARAVDADESDNAPAPEDVQNAFFESLASTTEAHREQVIVFENKEPPESVKAMSNYVQFTATEGLGRLGFIPRAP